jgi:hypothetical protein
MAALTADRYDTFERASAHSMPHAEVGADSTQFFKGGIVVLDSADGKMKKGATSTTQICLGRCEENVLTGTSNTRKIKCRSGIFKWLNSAAGDAIAADDIGKPCFIVDDQTVALTDGTGTRSRAGIVHGVDSDGVWVSVTFPVSIS